MERLVAAVAQQQRVLVLLAVAELAARLHYALVPGNAALQLLVG